MFPERPTKPDATTDRLAWEACIGMKILRQMWGKITKKKIKSTNECQWTRSELRNDSEAWGDWRWLGKDISQTVVPGLLHTYTSGQAYKCAELCNSKLWKHHYNHSPRISPQDIRQTKHFIPKWRKGTETTKSAMHNHSKIKVYNGK